AGLTSSEALAATILSALEITPEPHVDPAHQLLAELRQREALLVLDNFEHLLAGVDLITQIIQHTRRAVLLITSRERLALQSERVFELEGLDYPPEEGNGDGERYSAVQLFIDRARQATRKFQPARELAPIVRICRLVEGLPLAIELAASTVNAQSCAIIAAEIANDLKFLATKFRDVPERHRSMQATFDHSWRLLTVGEQSVFRQLAVFRGGFEWGAAQQVAQATREILTTLAAKSLLRGGPSGRFELHELLRQFAAEQLSRVPAEARAVGAQHSAYYLQLLHEQVDRLSSAHQADAFDRLTAEVDNVRSAWRWAVSRHQWEGIRSSALDLMSWCDYQVYYSDGYQLFAEAIDQLQIGAVPVESLDAERASAEGQVLTGHGYFLWRMGHNERAQHDLQHGLDRLRRANDTAGLADNLIGLGAVSASLGQYEVALAHFEESAELYDQLHDRTGYALATLQTGIVNRSFGNYEAAGQQMEQALAVYRQLGDQKMVANSLCQYARLLVMRGQVEQAQRPLQEGLTISHAISDRWANSGALVALGQVEYAQGHFEEARRALAESVQELTDLNEFERMVDALIWQGLSELALGDHVVADRHLREALRLAHQGSLRRCQSGALLGLAEMQAQHEQFDCALELADCVHNHLATERSTRDRAGRLRAALTARLAPAPLKAIQRRVQDRSLDEIIDVVLKEAN
ncbi:MAG TPA: tetratricopeptide repeat protein, partial [Anaerolineae bacterium]|nr:tetratricopeptide repeat protein [Anaerolineae bacterium]